MPSELYLILIFTKQCTRHHSKCFKYFNSLFSSQQSKEVTDKEISIENKFLKVPKLESGEDKISTLIDWLKNLCSQSIFILNKIILPLSYVLLDWQIHLLLQISH